jgi:hypothetical protein
MRYPALLVDGGVQDLVVENPIVRGANDPGDWLGPSRR